MSKHFVLISIHLIITHLILIVKTQGKETIGPFDLITLTSQYERGREHYTGEVYFMPGEYGHGLSTPAEGPSCGPVTGSMSSTEL